MSGVTGSLPVLNQKVVELALRAALALHCQILPQTLFHRKNYFYPDLPKGYQISQYNLPIGIDGFLEFYSQGVRKKARIRRIHIEEDAGKLVHEGAPLPPWNIRRGL